ncbi:hypothetical protein CBM2599_A70169 [Cupriavidus taiwanensis]|nr:hypothetical protein CBM2599_A70169 [Cupriavidus taiwanensis]
MADYAKTGLPRTKFLKFDAY